MADEEKTGIKRITKKTKEQAERDFEEMVRDTEKKYGVELKKEK